MRTVFDPETGELKRIPEGQTEPASKDQTPLKPLNADETRELASLRSEIAINALESIARDAKAPAAARVAASSRLLDQAHGKPMQSVEMKGGMTLLALIHSAYKQEAALKDVTPRIEEKS